MFGRTNIHQVKNGLKTTHVFAVSYICNVVVNAMYTCLLEGVALLKQVALPEDNSRCNVVVSAVYACVTLMSCTA